MTLGADQILPVAFASAVLEETLLFDLPGLPATRLGPEVLLQPSTEHLEASTGLLEGRPGTASSDEANIAQVHKLTPYS